MLSKCYLLFVLSALSAMENPIKLVEYSDSNSKTSMLSLRRTGLHIIYSIPLLFLKIPQTNEILCVLSVSVNYSLFVLSALSAKENPIKLVEYSDSNSKTSMLSLRRTGLHIIYSIPLLFLKIPQTNEILCVLSVSVNYSLFVLSALSAKENPIKLVEYSGPSSKIDKTTNMKVLSSPFYLLFNTNLFLCFLRCFYKSLQICVI